MIIPLTNQSKNFYAHLGKVFGSREVAKITGDRFYDDDDKTWYVYFDKGEPSAFVSVQNAVIKNVWGESREHIKLVLREINKKEKIKESIVPIVFQNCYESAGFLNVGNGLKNFIRIRGTKNE